MAIESFTFTIDSKEPQIELTSPQNNSIFPAVVDIKFIIIEFNLDSVIYTINNGDPITFNAPYRISTLGWSDGKYTVEVDAKDKAGQSTVKSFIFTIDSTKPQIELISPEDNSEIPPGTIIDLEITDPNLVTVNYSLTGGKIQDLIEPYDIDTTGFSDGDYNLQVQASDAAGNIKIKMFGFTIKSKVPELPRVVSTIPDNGTDEIPIDTPVVIEFSLEMNTTSVELSISVSPATEIADYNWNNDNTIVTITFSSNLDYGTKYTITISPGAVDALYYGLAKPHSFSFTTKLDTDGDDIPESTGFRRCRP
jgi:hypothetical protein